MNSENPGNDPESSKKNIDGQNERYEGIRKGDFRAIPFFELLGVKLGYQALLERSAGKPLEEFSPFIQQRLVILEAELNNWLATAEPQQVADKGRRLYDFVTQALAGIDQEFERRKNEGDSTPLF